MGENDAISNTEFSCQGSGGQFIKIVAFRKISL